MPYASMSAISAGVGEPLTNSTSASDALHESTPKGAANRVVAGLTFCPALGWLVSVDLMSSVSVPLTLNEMMARAHVPVGAPKLFIPAAFAFIRTEKSVPVRKIAGQLSILGVSM